MHSIINLTPPRAVKNEKDFLKGQIKLPASQYQPKGKAKDRLLEILKKFTFASQTHTKPYNEFNGQSLIQIQDECQKLFLNNREEISDDREERWKSRAVRPIVRNRAISIAAHITGTVIQPRVSAQNEHQQSDKDAATVMEDLMEWANEQCEYVRTFLYSVIAAIVNPATIIHTEYCAQWKTTKEVDEDGKWKEKKVLDELMSGFRDTLVPLDELFIADVYEHDIQKQPYLIWRRMIHWNTAFQKYADNRNFIQYVRPGIHAFFDSATNSFYDLYDENQQDQYVEEVLYYDRHQDLCLAIVNGVLLDDPDKPNYRKDKLYPFISGGYELIDEGKFFYYFSLVRKMKDDAEIINTLYRMVIDGTFLQLMPPTAIYGDEIVNSSVVSPGTVNTFKETTRLEKIDVGGNLNAGFNALEKIEASVSESSNDVLQSGQGQAGPQTAFEISRLEQNARIMLGMFAKMISFMVRDLGTLRLGDILQFLTVGDVTELVGDDAPLKYASFLIPNKTDNGKTVSHKIMFDAESQYNPEDIMAMEGGAMPDQLSTMDEDTKAEYKDKGYEADVRLFIANPTILRDLKYKVIVKAEQVVPESDALIRALNIELYDRAIKNPLANQEAIFKDLLLGSYDKTKNNTNDYVQEQQIQPGQPQDQSQGQPSVLNKLFGQGATASNNMATAQPAMNAIK